MTLIYGKVKATDLVVPLQVDANGVISVAAAKGDLNNQNHGYIGGAWQKNPIPFGMSSSLLHTWALVTPAAGTITAASDVVPAGELWVVTFITGGMLSASVNNFIFRASDGVNTFDLYSTLAPASGVAVYLNRNLYLAEAGVLQVITLNTTIGDTIWGGMMGYKIDVDL